MQRRIWKSALWVCLALGVTAGLEQAQTRVHLTTQGKSADFSSFEGGVRPWKAGVEMPPACQVGDAFFRTDLPSGHNLFVCVTGNSWKATNYDPGIGIVLAGNTIQVEDAVIPSYRTGHGVPSGTCSAGRDFYVDLDQDHLHFCSREDTWTDLKQGAHTHSAAEVVAGTVATNRGGTGTGTAEANTVLVGNGTNWVKAALPQCSDAIASKLLYSQATGTFSCGADQSSTGASGLKTTEAHWIFVASSSSSTSYPNLWAIPSTGGVSPSRTGTAPNQLSALIFANAADQRISTTFGLHPLYDSGLSITVYWYATTNATDAVKWGVQSACSGSGAVPPATELTTVDAVAAHNGVTGGLNRTTITLNSTGCAPSDLVTLRLLRDGLHDQDTLAASAVVYGVQVRYLRGL